MVQLSHCEAFWAISAKYSPLGISLSAPLIQSASDSPLRSSHLVSPRSFNTIS